MKIKLDVDRKQTSFFQTSEFGLVATLLTLGFHVDHLDNSNPNRVTFFFIQVDELAETLKKYWDGSLCVEPKSYWNTLRELKGRIRNDWPL